MSVINSDSMRAGAAGTVAGYVIDQSIRLNDDDSADMTFTMAAGTSTRLSTFSFWLKRCNLGSVMHPFATGGTGYELIRFLANDTLRIDTTGSQQLITTQVFRDVGAWMHIVVAIDTTQGTDTNRVHLYVNGTEVTVFDTAGYPALNADFDELNVNTKTFSVGTNAGENFDGYLADFVFIDGTQNNVTDFGEFDANGNWVPIDVSGLTFGTNGFYLDFAVAPGTGNGAGTDVSGNGNHLTDNGLAANDQVTDSPTDDAENDVGNFMTWNPLNKHPSVVMSNGNLKCGVAGATDTVQTATHVLPAGKWYWEVEFTAESGSYPEFGVYIGDPHTTHAERNLRSSGAGPFRGAFVISSGALQDNTVGANSPGYTSSFTAAFSSGDIGMVAVDNSDLSDVSIWLGKDGTWGNSGVPDGGTGVTATGALLDDAQLYPACANYSDTYATLNSGQTTFAHPIGAGNDTEGFKPVCTAHFPAPAITDPSKYFQVDTFTGTGSELVRTLTDGAGGAVKPDLVWIKDRDSSTDHVLTDSVRGATKELNPNQYNTAESTVSQGLKSFDTSGYTLGTDSDYNASSSPNVAWCWVTEGGAGSSNTDGSINTITTSVNTISGFSISTFTGTGANATVGHGLDSPAEFVITKHTTSTSLYWRTWHVGMAANKEIYLDATSAQVTAANAWNSTIPSSTVVSLGSGNTNVSGAVMLMNCFHSVEGYSKFGSYIGNANADGTFVWCGFRPAFLLTKSIDSTSNWELRDSSRGQNDKNKVFFVDQTDYEYTPPSVCEVDLLSNGFKMRDATLDPNIAETYIFAAFAEFPFGGEDVSQARAR